MTFIISKECLQGFKNETADVVLKEKNGVHNTHNFGSCGNNCSGTCENSPCTNLCAATSH